VTVSPKAILPLFALLVAIPGCGNTHGEQSASAQTHSSGANTSAEVVATVDGQSITATDLDETTAGSVAKLEEQIYQLKRDRLEELIADRLLASEAKRRGITVDALVAQEITSKVAPVTDNDVEKFVAENRERIQGDPVRLTPRIKAYLGDQRVTSRREAFIGGLRAKANVDVLLKAPAAKRFAVKTDGFPTRGNAAAPVTIVEFSDFHCPFCRAAQPTLSALLAKYPDKVRVVYRHFPLDSLHPEARQAAEASWCAEQQNKFWQYHDRLYANGPDGSAQTLERIATEAGLDTASFKTCVAGTDAKAAVQRDVDEGVRFGVDGTPGFFVNGRMLSGNQPMQTFVTMIDDELKAGK
jgi:protein-disulfide isomerase